MRYFHCTSKEQADSILERGFSRGPIMEEGVDQWLLYAEYFLPYLSAEERDEYTYVDKENENLHAGDWLQDLWTARYGMDWVIIWVGTDEVRSEYGDTVLEFIPPVTARKSTIVGCTAFVDTTQRFSAKCFRLLK